MYNMIYADTIDISICEHLHGSPNSSSWPLEVTRQGQSDHGKGGVVMVVKPVARAYILSGHMPLGSDSRPLFWAPVGYLRASGCPARPWETGSCAGNGSSCWPSCWASCSTCSTSSAPTTGPKRPWARPPGCLCSGPRWSPRRSPWSPCSACPRPCSRCSPRSTASCCG